MTYMKPVFTLFILLLTQVVTAQSFNNIESAEYDPINQQWLVSNANSIVSQSFEGDLNFFFDAEADYGMEVIGDTLYAINSGFSVNTVRCYNLNTGEQIATIELTGSSFPNGMASNGIDKLWVTDFGTQEIIEVDVTSAVDATIEVVASTGFTPNGIVHDAANNRCLMVSWGSGAAIYEMDLTDYSVSLGAGTTLSNIDGIDMDAAGNVFIASWSPAQIRQYTPDLADYEIVTVPGLSAPADISYAQEVDTLAIPNSGNNTLTLIGFGATGIDDLDVSPSNFTVYPNPFQQSSQFAFNIETSGNVVVKICDATGRFVWQSDVVAHPAGQHRMVLAGVNLSAGSYVATLNLDGIALEELTLVVE